MYLEILLVQTHSTANLVQFGQKTIFHGQNLEGPSCLV